MRLNTETFSLSPQPYPLGRELLGMNNKEAGVSVVPNMR